MYNRWKAHLQLKMTWVCRNMFCTSKLKTFVSFLRERKKTIQMRVKLQVTLRFCSKTHQPLVYAFSFPTPLPCQHAFLVTAFCFRSIRSIRSVSVLSTAAFTLNRGMSQECFFSISWLRFESMSQIMSLVIKWIFHLYIFKMRFTTMIINTNKWEGNSILSFMNNSYSWTPNIDSSTFSQSNWKLSEIPLPMIVCDTLSGGRMTFGQRFIWYVM